MKKYLEYPTYLIFLDKIIADTVTTTSKPISIKLSGSIDSSSVLGGSGPDLATDGNPETYAKTKTLGDDSEPYISLEFDRVYKIQFIKIIHGGKVSSGTDTKLDLRVGTDKNNPYEQPICNTTTTRFTDKFDEYICDAQGSIVFVTILDGTSNNQKISLNEIEVYGSNL